MARPYSLVHLTDQALLHGFAALLAQECTRTAEILAHIAEVDSRRLYLPAGYPSMFAFCVQEQHLSEDAAYKRIQAARAARKFPAIFDAVAEGRLHLSAACMLAPYLTPENADGLLKAATYKTKAEIEALLAARFPRSETLALAQAIPPERPPGDEQLAPGQVAERVEAQADPPAAPQVEQLAPRPKVAPVAPERFLLQLTIGRSTHDKLRYAQALLSHQAPSGDVAEVLDRALDALIPKLEKTKFAATDKPRASRRRSSVSNRHMPAAVKRAVWERDGGQCTFVGPAGHRCAARKFLEFDHGEEVARGGEATVENIRLRCRGHNQFEAECTFGVDFMRHKRHEAQRARAEARAKALRKVGEARERAAVAARQPDEGGTGDGSPLCSTPVIEWSGPR